MLANLSAYGIMLGIYKSSLILLQRAILGSVMKWQCPNNSVKEETNLKVE